MKTLVKILFALAAIVAVVYFAHAGPPTCSVCVTQLGLPITGGSVSQSWYDSDGHHHTEYLLTPSSIMCLHNGCELSVITTMCDGATSNRVLTVLFTCPPSTNAVVSQLWLPACGQAGAWSVSWLCTGCQLTMHPDGVSLCPGCNGGQ